MLNLPDGFELEINEALFVIKSTVIGGLRDGYFDTAESLSRLLQCQPNRIPVVGCFPVVRPFRQFGNDCGVPRRA
jgi:hypothetical protein